MLARQRQKITAYVSETLSFERLIVTGLFLLLSILITFIFIIPQIKNVPPEIVKELIGMFKEMCIFILGSLATVLQNALRTGFKETK